MIITFFKEANFFESYFSKNLSKTKFAANQISATFRPTALLITGSDLGDVVLVSNVSVVEFEEVNISWLVVDQNLPPAFGLFFLQIFELLAN